MSGCDFDAKKFSVALGENKAYSDNFGATFVKLGDRVRHPDLPKKGSYCVSSILNNKVVVEDADGGYLTVSREQIEIVRP